MALKIFFWFFVFYFLFKFIFKFVLPLLLTTRNVRAKMKDVRQQMEGFDAANAASSVKEDAFSKKTSQTSGAKGDYIDFEEIK